MKGVLGEGYARNRLKAIGCGMYQFDNLEI